MKEVCENLAPARAFGTESLPALDAFKGRGRVTITADCWIILARLKPKGRKATPDAMRFR